MQETPRLLFVHAHPDDESLANGATIAHYAACGAQVHVVTCTLGEEGEVIGDRWAQLGVDHADQLGGYRIGELTAALRALGVDAPIFLGGPGRWRDSGMPGTALSPAPRRQERFIDADEREAVGALVSIIRRLRPHVVVTYDANGGYGHPDHVGAHVVTTAAVAAAGTDDFLGTPWTVPKFYWTVIARSAFTAGWGALGADDLRSDWVMPSNDSDALDFGSVYSDDEIDAVVEATDALPAKTAALAAHATQLTIGPTGRACALSNNLALPILGQEHYILAAGVAGDRDERGWETDLLAGLDLTAAKPSAGEIAGTPATGAVDPAFRIVVLTLLAVDGALSAIAGGLLLPVHLGATPFPISALVSGLVNAALVWAAGRWTRSARLAALPLWTWVLTVAAMTLGGPGDDVILSGSGVLVYSPVLLVLLGLAPPVWVLRRCRARS
jgi:N-acetyl-1-D-myo-inositol-2-amino-2-deoxy-alpha-D-glucopyranoside deacetylase